MLPPRDAGSLLDILNAAQAAQDYVRGRTYESFFADPQCQDAVIRRLEVVGEAARRVTPATQETLKDIPWEQMIGLRNVMIHDYDDIDLQVIWNTVQKDLPPLIETLKKLIPPSEPK